MVEKNAPCRWWVFQNFGVATALDVVSTIDDFVEKQSLPVRIVLIALTIPLDSNVNREQSHAFGELMSPVRTLLHTRNARGQYAVRQAQLMLRQRDESRGRTPNRKNMERMRLVLLDLNELGLPLGWQLSAGSRDKICDASGFPERCTTPLGDKEASEDANCIVKAIFRELSGRDTL